MRADTAWTSAAALALAALVGVTGVLQAASPAVSSRATTLLAADGASTLFGTTDDYTRLETAVLPLGAVVSDGPPALMFGANLDDTSLTYRRERESGPAGTTLYRLRTQSSSGVATTVEVGARSATMWKPGRLDLPANVAEGLTWESSGDFADIDPATLNPTNAGRYRTTSTARKDGACLAITRDETRNDATTRTVETWCPGRGIVARATPDKDAQPLTDLSPGAPAAPAPAAWPDPATWKATTTAVATPPPVVLTVSRTPVFAGNRVVGVQDIAGDIVTIDGAAGPSVVAHPGGDVTALAGFGNSVVVAGTRRTLSSYNVNGTWQWTTDLPDVVRRPIARLGADRLIAADLSGTVHALDGRTGAIVWSWVAGDGVTAAPAAASTTVVIADDSPQVTVLTSAGTLDWQQDLDEPALAVATDDHIVAAATAYRLALYDRDGSGVRAFAVTDTTIDLLIADGWTIRHSNQAVYGYSLGGATWSVDAPNATVASDGHTIVVARSDGTTFALDATGREIGRWSADALPGKTALCFATPTGVDILYGNQLVRIER